MLGKMSDKVLRTCTASRHLRRLALAVLCCALAGSVPALAGKSVDQSLLDIEQVEQRLSSMPGSVPAVVKAAVDRGHSEAAEVAPILTTAAKSAFDGNAMGAEISEGVASVDAGVVDEVAFAKAATAFEGAREKVAQLYVRQDQAAATAIEKRLAGADGAGIAQLADLMAAPELAVEAAVTAQAMYVSLDSFSTAGAEDLASTSKEQMEAQLPDVVASLRIKTENEKPVPKDVARMEEKARLTFILATMTPEDLSTLSDFYQSAVGKAKRQALVDCYRRVSDQANIRMLREYLTALAVHLEAHPRPQQ